MRFPFFTVLLVLSAGIFGQSGKANFSDLKEGTFYYIEKSTKSQIIIHRTTAKQSFSDVNNGDTTSWKITWLNDSSYSLKFISCNCPDLKSSNPKIAKALDEHVIIHQILSVTDDYYTLRASIDKPSNSKKFEVDTVWIKDKGFANTKKISEPVKIQDAFKKKSITDTSSFALLYIYRKGKFVLSAINFNLYLNDIGLTQVDNKSAFVFKIFKNGPIEFKAKTEFAETKKSIDIQFGKKYFIRLDPVWNFKGLNRHHGVDIVMMDNVIGEQEFSQAQ